MRMYPNIWDAVKQWIWPTYQPKAHNYYYSEYTATPVPAPALDPRDPHVDFVGYNPEGNLVKAAKLPFVDANTTDFATIRAYAKNKAVEANIEPTLTTADRAQLVKRKPTVPDATAATMKAVFADKGGVTTADELATITGFSKSYAAAALAAFRAALPPS